MVNSSSTSTKERNIFQHTRAHPILHSLMLIAASRQGDFFVKLILHLLLSHIVKCMELFSRKKLQHSWWLNISMWTPTLLHLFPDGTTITRKVFFYWTTPSKNTARGGYFFWLVWQPKIVKWLVVYDNASKIFLTRVLLVARQKWRSYIVFLYRA